MPVLHVLAGSNGAGKSSYVRDVLQPATGIDFINADEIAAERWPGEEQAHSYEAARVAAGLRARALAEGRSFITETVFSHPSKTALVADAASLGYLIHLHVVVVPVELAVQRVSERVRRGGHTVPEGKIRDRYGRLWNHVAAAARLADMTVILDNSSARRPFRPVATLVGGKPVGPVAWPPWTPEPLQQLHGGTD